MFWLLLNKLLLIIVFAGSSLQAQIQTLDVSPLNTEIKFSIKHLGVLNVNGGFDEFSGIISRESEKLLAVECTVKVGSINTADDDRDETLRSQPYFDVESYPEIRFESVDINQEEQLISGLLTIKGHQNKVDLQYEFVENLSELIMKTTIDREDFKLHFGSMNALIGDKVKIEIRVRL